LGRLLGLGVFTVEPKLAASLNQQHRYYSACSAALAAAGQGEDAHVLPDKTAAMFRRWSLCWLRDDLTSTPSAQDRTIPPRTRRSNTGWRWRINDDLASLHDP
jgi:hypothetical protein